jgi:hypothetical protein
MTIEEVLGLDFELCSLDELLALMDRPGYFEVSNYYRLFNYLPLDEIKISSDNFFICYKSAQENENPLESYIYYKLYYKSDILFVCKLYMQSLDVALLDRSVYNTALIYLNSLLDLSLLETKELGDVL